MSEKQKLLALLWLVILLLSVTGVGAEEPLQYKPEKARGFNAHEGLMEVNPPGGFFLKFIHGPNSTLAVYRSEQGRGRDLPLRINRHAEETGTVLYGSVLFRAGYGTEFTRILRAGDSILIPTCVPHGGIFGWDRDEETLMVSTFTEKYVEYGPDDAGGAPEEFTAKVQYDEASGVAASEECARMEGAPPVSWTVDSLRADGANLR